MVRIQQPETLKRFREGFEILCPCFAVLSERQTPIGEKLDVESRAKVDGSERRHGTILAARGGNTTEKGSCRGCGAFQDPTHVSFWNENSFFYYTNREWSKYIDTPVRFQPVRLFTTSRDRQEVCWTRFDLVSLKDGHRPPGQIFIKAACLFWNGELQ